MTSPVPIAVRLGSEITLRGHEWPLDGPPVALLHDFDEDLDEWGPLPRQLARAGFRVISVELRGHGLSDGDPDPETLEDDTRDLITQLHPVFGPVGLVCHGRAARVAFALGAADGAPVHVLVSPLPGDRPVDWDRSTAALRLLVVGSLHPPTKAYVEQIYPDIRGQKLWISTAAEERGPELLHARPHLVEQITLFLRRYLPEARRQAERDPTGTPIN